MKTSMELRATLDAVIARLEGGPKTSEEWAIVAQQLGEAKAYAEKTMRLKARIEGMIAADAEEG